LVRLLWQNKIKSGLFTGLCFLLTYAISEASVIGGTSGAYLRAPAGAAALAQGGANTAYPDYMTPWWNPAIMAMSKTKKASVGIGLRSLGRTEAFASYEFRVPPRVGAGIAFLYRGDPFLNDLYDSNEEPIDNASYTTLTTKIGISYYINRKFSAGINVGIFYQRLPTASDENGSVTYSSTKGGIGSFDFALAYKHSEKLNLALVIRDVGAYMDWEIRTSNDYLSSVVEDRPLPSIILGSKYKGTLRDKPLIWNVDLKGYFFDGKWNRLYRPEANLSAGWEWQYWDKFYIRAGIGDFLINGKMISKSEKYLSVFPFRITTGFSFDLSRSRQDLKLNYGIATDKAWAGIDQQIDLSISF